MIEYIIALVCTFAHPACTPNDYRAPGIGVQFGSYDDCETARETYAFKFADGAETECVKRWPKDD